MRRTVSFTWVGDIAMVASSEGGAGFFSSSIRQSLRSNVVIGNLEGTLTSRGSSKCGANSTQCFSFRAPTSYAPVLRRAGFTLMNVANSHAYDYGSQGRADTLAALRSVGLRWDGLPSQISIVTVHGVRVAR
jgi:hypothetical protein